MSEPEECGAPVRNLLHKDKNKKLVASPVKPSKVFFLNLLPSLSHLIFLLFNQCWNIVLQNNIHFTKIWSTQLLNPFTIPVSSPLHVSYAKRINAHFLLEMNCAIVFMGQPITIFRYLGFPFFFTTLSLWEVDSFFDSDVKGIKSTNKRYWKVRWADQAYHFCHILSLSLPSVWEFETWTWSSQIAVQYMAMTSSEDLSNRELLFLNKHNPYHKKIVSFSMQTLELNFKALQVQVPCQTGLLSDM